MPRKNVSIINLLAVFPWWIVLVIAVASYAILKYVFPLIAFDNYAIKRLTYGLSTISPVLFSGLLILSTFSLINRLGKGKTPARKYGADAVQHLSWRQFENLVGEAFRKKGYVVFEKPSDAADGGVDLRLRKKGELIFVQCKHWKTRSIDVHVVREIYAIITAINARKGILATFGTFTQDAKEFAKGKPIQLMTGPQLIKLISEVQKNSDNSSSADAAAKCPECGSEMVIRIAKNGKYAGKKFRECSQFPHCKGVMVYKSGK